MSRDLRSEGSVGQWIAAAREGDEEAFGRLVAAYRSRLLERIRMIMGDRARRAADSTDFVHDVFVDLLRRPHAAPLADERSLLRWMTAIARNRIRGDLRRDRERSFSALSRSIPRLSDEGTPSQEARRRESLDLLAEALEELSEPYRRVIELRDLDGLPFREVGRRLGKSEDAARKLYGRAMIRLGEAARDMTGGP